MKSADIIHIPSTDFEVKICEEICEMDLNIAKTELKKKKKNTN